MIDKDLASELLAREVDAELFVMATDVDGVYEAWGTPHQRRLDRVTPDDLRNHDFASGSMGPKVDAAIRFVEATASPRRSALSRTSTRSWKDGPAPSSCLAIETDRHVEPKDVRLWSRRRSASMMGR